MQGIRSNPAADRGTPDVELATVVTNLASRRVMRGSASAPSLRCVSSGYLSGGCSCDASIPIGAVADAWARERRAGVHGERFFRFTWRGGTWLGFGLKDGRVSGVYCPTHSAERDRRSITQALGEKGVRANIALTG
ncbi:MAG: hypothetical protein JWL67_1059 [Solirubrobacterales bacterium]|nr:hypothetical protein [Solirubrobacterales bacterium]